MRILEVVGLTCRVGGVAVLDALSFTVEEGEIFALCGPTGAGKTIGLRCLTGSLPFESGRLIYDGHEITGTDPRERARQGLVRVGEISTPPWSLTVAEAITMAAPRGVTARDTQRSSHRSSLVSFGVSAGSSFIVPVLWSYASEAPGEPVDSPSACSRLLRSSS